MKTLEAASACLALLLTLSVIAAAGQTPPKHTSTLGTAKTILPAELKPGEYAWHPEFSPNGPIVLIVSLPEQLAYVYRNGVIIGASTVSTGKKGHETPTGVFHDPAKKRGSLFEPLQQRAHALHAAAHVVRRRNPCRSASRLPRFPRLRAHAV